MSTINLPLWACEDFMKGKNDSIFADLELPEGITKKTLTDNILLQGAEFEVIYPNPEFLKSAIGLWSRRMLPTFTKWVEALSVEFSPIENYDRYEDHEKNNTGFVTNEGTTQSTGTVKHTGTQSDSGTAGASDNNSTLNKVSAFDSDTMRDDNNTTFTSTSSSNTSNTRTDDLTTSNSAINDMNNVRQDQLKETLSIHAHGNIGVTKSTEMLQDYVNTYAALNIYNQITDLFLTEFCLMVY